MKNVKDFVKSYVTGIPTGSIAGMAGFDRNLREKEAARRASEVENKRATAQYADQNTQTTKTNSSPAFVFVSKIVIGTFFAGCAYLVWDGIRMAPKHLEKLVPVPVVNSLALKTAFTIEAVRVCNVPFNLSNPRYLTVKKVSCTVIEADKAVQIQDDPTNDVQYKIVDTAGGKITEIGWASAISIWDKSQTKIHPYIPPEVAEGIPRQMMRLNNWHIVRSTIGEGKFYPFIRDVPAGSIASVSREVVPLSGPVTVNGCFGQYCQVTADLPGYGRTSGAIKKRDLVP